MKDSRTVWISLILVGLLAVPAQPQVIPGRWEKVETIKLGPPITVDLKNGGSNRRAARRTLSVRALPENRLRYGGNPEIGDPENHDSQTRQIDERCPDWSRDGSLAHGHCCQRGGRRLGWPSVCSAHWGGPRSLDWHRNRCHPHGEGRAVPNSLNFHCRVIVVRILRRRTRLITG